MKIEVLIKNTTKARINNGMIKRAVEEVMAGEMGQAEEAAELSIAFVAPVRIRELNKEYRKHDYVTDVLSFAETDIPGNGQFGQPRVLGELVICIQQVKEDAKDSQISFKSELNWVVVHGVLHLLGYDHEAGFKQAQSMRAKEEFYLSKLELKA